MENLATRLHPLERKLLPACEGTTAFEELVRRTGLQEVEVMRAMQWLENKGAVQIHHETSQVVDLGCNGLKYLKKGLPERRLLEAIKGEISLDEAARAAELAPDEVHVALGALKRKAAIIVRKDAELMLGLTEQGRTLKEKPLLEEALLQKHFPLDMRQLSDEDRFAVEELRKRKTILRLHDSKKTRVTLTALGQRLKAVASREDDTIERLTPAILRSGVWKKRRFRRYDVEINVPRISGGKRHFVDQAVDDIKRIWLDLGFREMKGTLVQTAFWDLDALFVPQDHPARDAQDTFYIKDPRYGKIPKELTERVKATHENGGDTGSAGWQYKWSADAAKENLLRTHTTVLSARTIASLKKEDLPAKFFSVKKVFRNEALSWKHLFEFVQVEGIVIDPLANFSHLQGYLKDFFRKMGYPDVRIRPGHFPYTEPSAEVDAWHPTKKKWVELGGSGIFRPEVVKPLLGTAVPVLAWGIGMERSIMEYYQITDIRDLYKNDLAQLREMRIWTR